MTRTALLDLKLIILVILNINSVNLNIRLNNKIALLTLKLIEVFLHIILIKYKSGFIYKDVKLNNLLKKINNNSI